MVRDVAAWTEVTAPVRPLAAAVDKVFADRQHRGGNRGRMLCPELPDCLAGADEMEIVDDDEATGRD